MPKLFMRERNIAKLWCDTGPARKRNAPEDQ
jgi:hypothetical protein